MTNVLAPLALLLPVAVVAAAPQEPRPAPGRGAQERGAQERDAKARDAKARDAQGGAADKKGPQELVVRFGWGPTGSVPVRETIATGGREVVLAYDLRWAKAGDGVALQRADARVVALDGKPAEDAAVAELAAQRLAQELAVPALTLDAKGRCLGVAEVKPEQAKALVMKHRDAGETRLAEELERCLREPAQNERARGRALEAWDLLFGLWQGARLAHGEPAETRRGARLGVVERLAPAKVTAQLVGPVERDGKTLARVRLRAVQEAEDVRRAFREGRDGDADAGDGGPAASAPPITSRTLEVEGLFEPATFRPHHVTATSRVVLRGAEGKEPPTVEEKRTFVLDWSAAKLPQPGRKAEREHGEGGARGQGGGRGDGGGDGAGGGRKGEKGGGGDGKGGGTGGGDGRRGGGRG